MNNVTSENKKVNNITLMLILVGMILIGLGSYLLFFKNSDKVTDNNSKTNETIKSNGIMDDFLTETRMRTYKELAIFIISGVKKELLINNKLEKGDYYFTSNIYENGGKSSPLGGEIAYITSLNACEGGEKINDYICRVNSIVQLECTDNSKSFVRVSNDSGNYSYSICLTAGTGNKYIDVLEGTEKNLYNSDYSMIK